MDREVVFRSEMVHATISTVLIGGRYETAFILDGHVSDSLYSVSKDEARQAHYLAKAWMAAGASDVDHPLYGSLHRRYASMLRDVRESSPRWSGKCGRVIQEVAS